MAKKILTVFAHPDDESFCSGTLLKYAAEGAAIYLVYATKGERGQSGDYQINNSEELGEIRAGELEKAAKMLGIEKIYFLGFGDGELKNVDSQQLQGKIESLIEKIKPDVLITFGPEGMTGHPDHIAIGQATTIVGKKLQRNFSFPKKIYHLVYNSNQLKGSDFRGMDGRVVRGQEDDKISTRINVEGFITRKINAFKMHKSQMRDVENYIHKIKIDQQREECFNLVTISLKQKLKESDIFHGI